jgi:predicted dehydrogenase
VRTVRITINGTGFAGSYTAQVYSLIPHKNGTNLELAGVCSGHLESARNFATRYGVGQPFESHANMVNELHPDIDNIACANHVHGAYVLEAANAGVKVIVLEKPPVIWPGYAEGRSATAERKKEESMEYLGEVLDGVRAAGAKLLYAEDFVYFDGVFGLSQLMAQAAKQGKGKILYQTGVCAHQGSHAPAYDTPKLSGGGALFNKACHPLGPILYLKQIEGIISGVGPIRPRRVSAVAMQVLKTQGTSSGEHFRVMQNVDDFGRITVEFEDGTVAEVVGHDMSISGIRNTLSIITDYAQYDIRVNPNSANELFLPKGDVSGNILFREKLPTPEGTSFPSPNQFYAHGYVSEMNDAVLCALEPDRAPQSGPMLAWDTMAVLMVSYESSDADSKFIDIGSIVRGRTFTESELPDPAQVGPVFQTQ